MSAAIGCRDEAKARLRTPPAALMGSPEVQTILPHHTPPQDAGTVVSRAKPKLAVPETRKTYSGPLELGEDLTTFEIADSVIVHHVRP